jgi:hypothetical protein
LWEYIEIVVLFLYFHNYTNTMIYWFTEIYIVECCYANCKCKALKKHYLHAAVAFLTRWETVVSQASIPLLWALIIKLVVTRRPCRSANWCPASVSTNLNTTASNRTDAPALRFWQAINLSTPATTQREALLNSSTRAAIFSCREKHVFLPHRHQNGMR